MRSRPIALFLLKVLLWLPVTLGIWYFMSIVITLPITWLLEGSLTNLFPEVFAAVRQTGYHLVVWAKTTAAGDLVRFEINSLPYSNSLALYTALVLASPGEEGQKWLRWLMGIAILLLVTTWGVGLEATKGVMAAIPAVGGHFTFPLWAGRAAFISSRYNVLVLPTIMPIMIWIGFNTRFLRQLVPSYGKT
jgi:hypothetical protein